MQIDKNLESLIAESYLDCCEELQKMQEDSEFESDRFSCAKAQESRLVESFVKHGLKAETVSFFFRKRGVVDKLHFLDLVHGDIFIFYEDRLIALDLKMGISKESPGSISAKSLQFFSGNGDKELWSLCPIQHLYLCGFGLGSKELYIIDAKDLFDAAKKTHLAWKDSYKKSDLIDYSVYNARVKESDFISRDFLSKNFSKKEKI